MLNPIDPQKIIIHSGRIKDMLEGKEVAPVTLGLDISNLCDHQCIWCLYDDYKQDKPYIMPKDLINKSLTGFKEVEGATCCLSGGGEPLINPEINYAILKCKELGLECSLNTNGAKLNRLSDSAINALAYIRVSLDAGSLKSHNSLHKPLEGDFNDIIENIEGIRNKTKVPIGVGYLVHTENYNEIVNVCEVLEAIGIDYIQIRPLKNFSLEHEQLKRVFDQIDIIKNNFNIKVYESFSKMEDTINKEDKCRKCYINQLVANIGPDGEVYICCELRGKTSIGNIGANSFKEIWFSKKHKNILDNLDIRECPPCKYSKMNEIIESVFVRDELNRNFI